MRKDIYMDVGKLAAQSGHAFSDTLNVARQKNLTLEQKYQQKINAGSKVVLAAKKESDILHVYLQLKELNIPCSVVIDRNHIFPPDFDGTPIITGIGIGPCTKGQVRHILKKFQVYKEKKEMK